MEDRRSKIKVLVVDDSFFMRKLLRQILDTDARMEVVGEAKDGESAVEMAQKIKPDAITMDYRMPKLNGAQVVEKILDMPGPLPAIIMVSAFTREGAKETMECLRAGAVDFVAKPSGELSLDLEKIKDEIIFKIINLAKVGVRKQKEIIIKKPQYVESKKGFVDAVVIGASTGGPPVLEDVVSALPENMRSVVFIAQHMPAQFTKSFAERLDVRSGLKIMEARDGEIIKPGRCYLAPGGYNMEIRVKKNSGEKFIKLEPSTDILCPSIDILMVSTAEVYKNRTLGIIFTGMGNDGLEGMRAVKNNSGITIVQDLDSAAVRSMPQSIIDQNLADEILTLEEVTKRIVELSSIK